MIIAGMAIAFSFSAALAQRVTISEPIGTDWKYIIPTSDPGWALNWTELGFDDSTWASGPAPLGYPASELIGYTSQSIQSAGGTVIGIPGQISAFFRREFIWPHASGQVNVRATNWVDDGVVLFINGREVYRVDIREGAIEWDTPPGIEDGDLVNRPNGQIASGVAWVTNGINVVAASVRNNTTSSSDLVWAAFISAEGGGPVIDTQPSNQTVALRQSASFSITASGNGLSYQWFKDGVPLPGQINSTLELTNVGPAHIGHYVARVSNSVSVVDSSGAFLSVTNYADSFWRGMTAYYPLEGSYEDLSPFRNHLGLVHGIAEFATNRFYKGSNGVSLTYAELVTMSNLGMPQGTNDFTISLWGRLDGRAGIHETLGIPDPHRVVFANQIVNDCQFSFYDVESESRPIPEVFLGGAAVFGAPNNTPGISFPSLIWHHLVVTRSGGRANLYIDGSLVYFGANSLTVTTDTLLGRISFGRRSNGDHAWLGELDDIRVYSRALPLLEVERLYAWENTRTVPHRATAQAIVENGSLVRVRITDFGQGYVTNPIVRLIVGGGIGAQVRAVVVNGAVTELIVIENGSGYSEAPRVLIDSPPGTPSLRIEVARVKVIVEVFAENTYLLESSRDLIQWSAIGSPFVAEADLITQEFGVADTGKYFRILRLE